MKRFKEAFVAVVVAVGFMGLLGYDCIAPTKCRAEEKAVKKEAVKETKAAAKKTVKNILSPAAMVVPQIFELSKNMTVDVMGSGFEPGQKLRILFTDNDGMQSDIGYALKPELKASKSGAFLTSWTMEEFIKAKLVTEGAFVLTVTDDNFMPLTKAYFFVKPEKKAEKK